MNCLSRCMIKCAPNIYFLHKCDFIESLLCYYSRYAGGRVSTSSETDRSGVLIKSNARGETIGNETASDEDSQLSYSTTGSPTPNTSSHVDSSPVSSQNIQLKSGSSGKV